MATGTATVHAPAMIVSEGGPVGGSIATNTADTPVMTIPEVSMGRIAAGQPMANTAGTAAPGATKGTVAAGSAAPRCSIAMSAVTWRARRVAGEEWGVVGVDSVSHEPSDGQATE